jgi:uncharacterized protein YkwD/uncharacterized membrane protein required for colicin V production
VSDFPFELVDLVIVGLVVVAALTGWRLGSIGGLVDALGLLAAIGLSTRFSAQLTTMAGETIPISPPLLRPVATLAIIVVGFIAAGMVARVFGEISRATLPPDTFAGTMNSLIGAVMGGLKASMLVGFVLQIGTPLLPQDSNLYNQIDRSRLSTSVISLSQRVQPIIRNSIEPIFSGEARVEPSAEFAEGQRLPIPEPIPLFASPESEERMLDLVNEERRQAGLPALVMSPLAREVAQQHSNEMFRLGYLSHTDKSGKSPPERLREVGINFTSASENVAFAPSVDSALRALLDNTNQRRNILSDKFRRVGIGIYDGGIWGIMVTQDFTD